MSKVAVLVIAAGVLALGSCIAHASVPSLQVRRDAKGFARDFWADRGHTTYCGGVRFRFRNSYEDRSVRSSLAYVPPGRCAITFNKRISWGYMPKWGWGDDWWRLCLTTIHEYGHLPGMPHDGAAGPVHSRNPNSVMASSEQLQYEGAARWWPHFPGCRYERDDQDGNGTPDY